MTTLRWLDAAVFVYLGAGCSSAAGVLGARP
jgi:hypothetical protein